MPEGEPDEARVSLITKEIAGWIKTEAAKIEFMEEIQEGETVSFYLSSEKTANIGWVDKVHTDESSETYFDIKYQLTPPTGETPDLRTISIGSAEKVWRAERVAHLKQWWYTANVRADSDAQDTKMSMADLLATAHAYRKMETRAAHDLAAKEAEAEEAVAVETSAAESMLGVEENRKRTGKGIQESPDRAARASGGRAKSSSGRFRGRVDIELPKETEVIGADEVPTMEKYVAARLALNGETRRTPTPTHQTTPTHKLHTRHHSKHLRHREPEAHHLAMHATSQSTTPRPRHRSWTRQNENPYQGTTE